MKEIEILVEIYNTDLSKVKEKLNTFTFIGDSKVIDTYYYDPLRKKLKPHEDKKLYSCLRIREKNNTTYLTYKDDIYENNIWQYSDELETVIDNGELLKSIFSKMGLKELLKLDSNKHFYSYGNYEIVLEIVKDLGSFLEVELQYENDIDYKYEKEQIQKFIDDLGLNVSKELNSGKPELFIIKHNLFYKLN